MKLLVLCYVMPAHQHNQAPKSEAHMDIVAPPESSQDADKSINAVEAEGIDTGDEV